MNKKRLLIALALGAFFGCATKGKDPISPPDLTAARLFLTLSNYQTGLLRWIDVEKLSLDSGSLRVYQDAFVKMYGGFVYVVERLGGDNILKFDPSKTDSTGVAYQKHLGNNYNPVDMAFVSDTKAFVSLENRSYLLIVNPQTGDSIGAIDLSAYIYQPDTGAAPLSPNSDQMILDGGKLYVSVQRRNGFSLGANGLIAVIDAAGDSVRDTAALSFKNPSALAIHGNKLFVACQGDLYGGTVPGALETVDLTTLQTAVFKTQSQLGGVPQAFAEKTGHTFYVQIYVAFGDVKIKPVDFSTGTVGTALAGLTDASGGMAYDPVSGKLFVGDRVSGGDGVRAFDGNNAPVGSLIKMSLPPYSMGVLEGQ